MRKYKVVNRKRFLMFCYTVLTVVTIAGSIGFSVLMDHFDSSENYDGTEAVMQYCMDNGIPYNADGSLLEEEENEENGDN